MKCVLWSKRESSFTIEHCGFHMCEPNTYFNHIPICPGKIMNVDCLLCFLSVFVKDFLKQSILYINSCAQTNANSRSLMIQRIHYITFLCCLAATFSAHALPLTFSWVLLVHQSHLDTLSE